MVISRAVHDSPQSWIFPYYSSFDGLRGLAFLAVFFMHYGPFVLPWQRNYPPLWAGVDLFFVLSGFLITGILYDARGDSHYFRNFYVRRALRIFPLYYGFFLAILLLRPLFHFTSDYYLGAEILYFGNLCVKGALLGKHGNPTLIWVPALHLSIGLGSFWSLCVEEQFYLVWPLILWLVPSRRRCMWLCAGGAGLVLLLRTLAYVHSSTPELATRFLYYSTWTRCDTLLIGAALALWLRGETLSTRQLHTLARRLIGGSLAVLALGFGLIGHRWRFTEVNPVFETYGYTAVAICCAGILLLAIDTSSILSSFLRSRVLTSLGKISYGLYFFHGLPWELFRRWHLESLEPHHVPWLILPIAFGWSWGAAWLSYRFLESPFLRLKRYLAPLHGAVPRLPRRLQKAATAPVTVAHPA